MNIIAVNIQNLKIIVQFLLLKKLKKNINVVWKKMISYNKKELPIKVAHFFGTSNSSLCHFDFTRNLEANIS